MWSVNMYKELKIDSIHDLVNKSLGDCRVVDDYGDIHGTIVYIAKYENAKAIIKELVLNDFEIANIAIEDESSGGYDKEFIVTLWDGEIWCEKLRPDWSNGKPLGYDADALYILEDCDTCCINEDICPLAVSIVRFDDANSETLFDFLVEIFN